MSDTGRPHFHQGFFIAEPVQQLSRSTATASPPATTADVSAATTTAKLWSEIQLACTKACT